MWRNWSLISRWLQVLSSLAWPAGCFTGPVRPCLPDRKEAHHHEHDEHGDHGHAHEGNFAEHHHHEAGDMEFGDAHERAHAAEMQKQLVNQQVTTGQIILFGLTGGLLPCPSALAVLLVCLQLKRVTLGFTLVMGFSIGLAITLVTVGTIPLFL